MVCLGREMESGLLHFSSFSREIPPASILASEPKGVKDQLGPRSEKLTMPPAGGRKSLLTPAQPASGAFLLSETLILETCTEPFIVKAALIPSKSKALGKKSCCAREALPPVGDPQRSRDSWV